MQAKDRKALAVRAANGSGAGRERSKVKPFELESGTEDKRIIGLIVPTESLTAT